MMLGYKEFKKILESQEEIIKRKRKSRIFDVICLLLIAVFIIIAFLSIYNIYYNIINVCTYVFTILSFPGLLSVIFINRRFDATKISIHSLSLIEISENENFKKICSKIDKDKVCAAIDNLKENQKTTLKYIWTGMITILIPIVSFFSKSMFADISFFTIKDIFFLIWFIGLITILIVIIPLFFNESLKKDDIYLQIYKNILSQMK